MTRIMVAMALMFLLVQAPASMHGGISQSRCGDHADIVDGLRSVFGERPTGDGLSADGILVEIFVSPAGSWTILNTLPGDASCLVAIGDDWHRPMPKGRERAASWN